MKRRNWWSPTMGEKSRLPYGVHDIRHGNIGISGVVLEDIDYCDKCGLWSGCLTTDCSENQNIPRMIRAEIYDGSLDFIQGEWCDLSRKE